MRTIKFRGKRIDNGKWVYGSLNECYSGRYYIIESFSHIDKSDIDVGFLFIEVDPTTVGQFTGLTDKNGKEIYEGNVVQVDTSKNVFGNIHTKQIAWSTSKGGFYAIETYCDNLTDYLCDTNGHNCSEIIGNLHDNPELIQK